MKHIHTFENFLNESEHMSVNEFETSLNELRLTSAGVKELLTAIYYNWDKIKVKIRQEYYFKSFKDVMEFLLTGDQEEMEELENVVKKFGVEILKLK